MPVDGRLGAGPVHDECSQEALELQIMQFLHGLPNNAGEMLLAYCRLFLMAAAARAGQGQPDFTAETFDALQTGVETARMQAFIGGWIWNQACLKRNTLADDDRALFDDALMFGHLLSLHAFEVSPRTQDALGDQKVLIARRAKQADGGRKGAAAKVAAWQPEAKRRFDELMKTYKGVPTAVAVAAKIGPVVGAGERPLKAYISQLLKARSAS